MVMRSSVKKFNADTAEHRHERVVLHQSRELNPNCSDCVHSQNDSPTNTEIYCELKRKEVKSYNKCNFFSRPAQKS